MKRFLVGKIVWNL